jgi:choline dehydrogenase
LRPQSSGEVRLKSPNVSDAPEIHPNYLAAAADRDVVVAGIRTLRQLFATEPLASHIVSELAPGEACQSDAAVLEFVRNTAESMHHWSGTCKMGSDPMAVVDDQLRVRSIDRLRVIDASIMPRVTSGNTNAPTIMIGEKGAALIKAAGVV